MHLGSKSKVLELTEKCLENLLHLGVEVRPQSTNTCNDPASLLVLIWACLDKLPILEIINIKFDVSALRLIYN